MPLTIEDVAQQVTGSTFIGEPTIVGGVYYGSGAAAYVQTLQTDVSGALFITSSGSLAVTGSLAVDNVVRVTSTGSLLVHVDGQISIDNFPATQNVTGSVSVFTQGPQAVTGSVNVYTQGAQLVSGAVNLGNWPTVVGVTGSVSTYTQGPQAVSGTVVAVGPSLTGSTLASNPVIVGGVYTSGSFVKALQLDVSGAAYVTATGSLLVHVDSQVSIDNFPATQNVSGTVNITNWPVVAGVTGSIATYTQGPQAVTGSLNVYTQGAQLVSGTVNLGNWPPIIGVTGSVSAYTQGPQLVSGSVAVFTQGAQLVSGSVNIGNWPPVHAVSGSQLTGSTFSGFPVVAGGVFVSGQGSIVKAIQTDTLGAQYVTTSGSLLVHVDTQVSVDNFPATQNVTGSVSVYTQGPQLITGSVSVYTQGPQNVTGSVAIYTQGAQAVTGSQLTGSTFTGVPVVVGGFFDPTVGNETVTAFQTDVDGNLFVVGPISSSSPMTVGNPVAVGGTDGTNARMLAMDTNGLAMVGSVNYAAANGRISGSISGHRFGFSSGAGTPQPLRATAYTEPTSAAQRSVSSNNAADASAGTGAQQVTITYYDNGMNGPLTEVVTLNGTTSVNTVNTNIRFIESIEVTRAGTGGVNAGTITLFGSTGGAGGTVGTIGVGNRVIVVGDNQTFWAHHYVRPLVTFYLTGITTSNPGAVTGQTYGKFVNPLVSTNSELVKTPMLGSRQGSDTYAFRTPIALKGPGRFTLYNSTTGANEADGSFEFMEF